MSFSSAGETSTACPRLRLRFEFFRRIKWRLPCLRRKTRPLPVTLNLLATAFLVLAFPPLRAIARGIYSVSGHLQSFSSKVWVRDGSGEYLHLRGLHPLLCYLGRFSLGEMPTPKLIVGMHFRSGVSLGVHEWTPLIGPGE